MDLLGENPEFRLGDPDFRIYSRNFARAPQTVGTKADVENSLISEGCIVEGKVVDSVLSGGVVIEEGAEVYGAVLMSDVVVKKGARVYNCIVDSDAVIGEDAVVGKCDAGKDEIAVIAANTIVEAVK